MIVSDLFESLSYGELSNLSIGLEGAGGIEESARPKIIRYANQALQEIHGRIPHNRDYVKIQLIEGRQRYPLKTAYTVSSGTESDKFIKDSAAEPFEGRVLKIIGLSHEPQEYAVSDVTELRHLPARESHDLIMNDRSGSCAVETLSYDTLFIRRPIPGMELVVEYFQAPKPLTRSVDLDEEISIAPFLESALELNIAARVYSAMNGEANMVKAQQLQTAYAAQIQLVQAEDLLQLSETDSHSKLADRGFV